MAVSMQRKQSAGSIHSQSLAYPSPSHSPAIGISRLPEPKLQWCQEGPVTTYDHQENIPAWSNGYPQRTHTPVVHNIQTTDASYACLPSPPPQTYNNLEAEYGAMSIDPRTRHMLSTPTSEAMMVTTSAEHNIAYTSTVATDAWTTTAYPDSKEQIAHLISLPQTPQSVTAMSPPLTSAYDGSTTLSMHTGFNPLQITPEPPKWENRSAPPMGLSSMGPTGNHTVRTRAAELSSTRNQARQKRQYTTRDKANYICSKCGKYFDRIWNFKIHKLTHDPNRDKPHGCRFEGCESRFVRRTDLDRHMSSVHLKEKKWGCGLCDRKFARKDTLRRHEDDGCQKRVDIPSRNGKGIMNPRFLNLADKFLPPPAPGSHMEMMPNPSDPQYHYQQQHQHEHLIQHSQQYHQQQHHEQQLGYLPRSQAPVHSGLPPLSVALQNSSSRPDGQHQQQMWR